MATNTPIDPLAMPKIKRFITQVNNSGRFSLDDEIPLNVRTVEKQTAKLKREERLIRVGPNDGSHWQMEKINK